MKANLLSGFEILNFKSGFLNAAFNQLLLFLVLLQSEVFHLLNVNFVFLGHFLDGVAFIDFHDVEEFFVSFDFLFVYHFPLSIEFVFLSED